MEANHSFVYGNKVINIDSDLQLTSATNFWNVLLTLSNFCPSVKKLRDPAGKLLYKPKYNVKNGPDGKIR